MAFWWYSWPKLINSLSTVVVFAIYSAIFLFVSSKLNLNCFTLIKKECCFHSAEEFVVLKWEWQWCIAALNLSADFTVSILFFGFFGNTTVSCLLQYCSDCIVLLQFLLCFLSLPIRLQFSMCPKMLNLKRKIKWVLGML